MKKLGLFLLILTLVLSAIPAHAIGAYGQGETIARNGELAAFMDGSGNIYVSGLNTPVNATKASGIISIDAYRILFIAQADAANGIPQGRLISLKLDDFAETIITDDASAACVDTESIYYISRSNPHQLIRQSLDGGSPSIAFTGNEELERIYTASSGVTVTLVENAGAYIQDAVSGQFIPYNGDIAAQIALFEDFDLYLTDSRDLYILEKGMITPRLVEADVHAWAVIDDTVYFLSGPSGSIALGSYNASDATQHILMTLPADMKLQLTASANSLFMLSNAHTIYSVDTANGRLYSFATLPEPSSFSLTGNQTVSDYRIEAVSGQLNVYGELENSSALPTFTFVSHATQYVRSSEEQLVLLSAYTIEHEQTVWDLLQPPPQYSPLRKGNRGSAVSEIQQPLYDLGYYDYYIDGIFGWRTQRAIELLQADLGQSINGIADEQLQRLILSGNLQPYDPYRALTNGDRGHRVQEMQIRLRDLGYLADDADGIFGSRTQTAILRFQEQHGLNANGSADAETLRKLYSASAQACKSYIDLQIGDSGYRVRELNRRLKELYYLEGDIGSRYTEATAQAIRRFQEELGMQISGSASSALQQQLFLRNAPEYSGYITLRRGDQNARVKDMQRRLRELGYYQDKLDGYYGKGTASAVKSFQYMLGIKDTGIADPETLARLYRSDAPAYSKPEKIKAPVIQLSAYSKYENGLFHIADSDTSDGNVTVSWFAEGDVAGYDIFVTDDRNTTYIDVQNTGMTIASIPVSALDADRTYTVFITAHPNDTRDDGPITSNIRFVRMNAPAIPTPTEEPTPVPTEEPTPVPTEEPTPEPTEDPTPVPTEEPTPVPTEEPTPEPTEEPTPVPTEEPTPVPTEEPTPEPTEEPTPVPTEEPTPVPTEEPTPEPTEEPTPVPTEEPTPVPTEEPTPAVDPEFWTEAITPDSSSEDITILQQRLAEWLWLPEEAITGALDETTIQAVIAFQDFANASGLTVQTTDPATPIVETDTLRLLFNVDGVILTNPNI